MNCNKWQPIVSKFCSLAGAPTGRYCLSLLTACLFLLLPACQRTPRLTTVTIEVDNTSRTLQTEAQTIREVLQEANIELGPLDRVNPDLNYSIDPAIVIRVTRITEETSTQLETLPFERRVVVNEALPPGEQRLAQLGVNGQVEIVTRITYEDGVEVSRTQVSKTTLQPPVEEVLVVGAEGSDTNVNFEGIITYLSGNNAWIMRNNSSARRPLTGSGDLDGRVFDLSPDGSTLLYTRSVSDTIDTPLNELWQIDTRIVGEKPISLPLKNLLYAEWSPNLTETVIAYSTGERAPGQPGWRANNDLWLWNPTDDLSDRVAIVPPNTDGLYAWWGTNFAWSPDGRYIAYAKANQVGVINIISQTITPLQQFAPYQTNSNWVWVPSLTWSPDSRFIATTIHGEPIEGESPERSPVFDLWLLAVNGTLKIEIQEQVGMWSNPAWHQGGIIFGQAVSPLNSINSRYKLGFIDWDGSNFNIIYPRGEEAGVNLPEIAWSPVGEAQSFIFVNRNNLFLASPGNQPPQKLTTDNQSHRPQWFSPITPASLITSSTTLPTHITQTHSLSSTQTITESIQ